MPPALVSLVLVALGVPAAVRALSRRPAHMPAAHIAALTAAVVAQAAGDVLRNRAGVVGDAQLLAAIAAALAATIVVIALERR